ncbi:MAG: hypothetical protein NWE92_12340 [Candidatus Bathyarchaeota archaeon]|nr:hypothetical protein [Candidatus Bathyarchaeota archaeon]
MTKTEPATFQVLLLDNDESLDVTVQESPHVDFSTVKRHLKNGGSVFITSKNSQKIHYPKTRDQTNLLKSRKNAGFLFRRHVRANV